MSYYLRHEPGQTVLLRPGKGEHDVMLLTSDDMEPELWSLVLRGAGLDPDTVCVSRTELLAVLEHVGGSMRTTTGEVLRGSEEVTR